MASSGGGPSSSKQEDSEDPRVFDFLPFYRQQEFCDRIIRLEILEDSVSLPANQAVRGSCSARGTVGEEDEGTGIDAQEDLGDCRDGDDRIVGRKRPRDPERTGSSDQSGSASSNASEGQEDPQEIEGEDANGARGLAEGETRRRRSARQMIREAAEQRRSQSEKELLHAAGDAVESIHGRDEVEEIPISAAVVAAKSDVLRTMILSKMKESQKEAPIVVKVTRREKAAFLEMLHFIYAGQLSDRLLNPAAPVTQLVDLVLAADKFGVGSLLTSINPVLQQRLTNVAAAEVIALGIPDAIRLSRREFGNLVNEARKIFLGGFKRVVDWASSSEFLALSQKGVELLLESEELEAADEEHVFGAVITWLSSNLDGLASKQEAMRSLARSIRFGCMRGEFLEREVLAMPEMRSVEVEALVREALSFRAWSDEEKLRACAERRFRERKGVADSNFEIFFTAELDDIGTSKRGPVVRWAKRDWWINLQMSGDKEPATVGLCLHTSGQVHGGSGQPADKVFVAISVRSWPSGYWALLKKSRSYWEFPQGEKRFRGYGNFFGMSWDEVRSSCYATCTGEVTLKIKLSRA